MKVSVIVPVYNVEQYLRQCLDSITGQTLKDIEIICVNDGSPDNCGAILDEYAAKDERVKIITQKNQGLACSRNNGMLAAAGEYVGFVDSDDWIDSDFCEKLYDAAKREDADIAGGDVMYWESEANQYGGYISWWTHHAGNTLVDDDMSARRDLIFACGCWYKIYRTRFLRENNFQFPAGKVYEDFPFTFATTASANKIVLDRTTNYYYRQRGNSLMTQGIAKISHLIDNHRLICDWLGRCGNPDFRKIENAFALFHLNEWARRAPRGCRNEFFREFKNLARGFDIGNNEFAWSEIRTIHRNLIRAKSMRGFLRKMKHAAKMRVFGIGGLNIISKANKPGHVQYYLLNTLRVWRRNHSVMTGGGGGGGLINQTPLI
jgi:glycosyltransferase involved in cell wall biosynthesis